MALAHFKALNLDSSEESDGDVENPSITREALEEKAVAEYTKVLLLQKNKQWKEAEEGFKELLESDVLCRVTGKVNYVSGRLQPSLVHLKYCVLINLGHVLTEVNEIKGAVNYYLEAVSLDDTDLNLWYRIGRAAIKIPNLNLASYAFQEALRCNHNHWPSLDMLITVLYASSSFLLCLYYISEALEKDSGFQKGVAFCQKIYTEHPSFKRDFPLYYPQCSLDDKLKECEDVAMDDPYIIKMFNEADSLKKSFETLQWPRENKDNVLAEIKPDRPLQKKSWFSVGRSLLQVYCRLKEEYPQISFYRPVNLSNEVDEVSVMEVDEEKDTLLDDTILDKEVDNINDALVIENEETVIRNKRRRSSPSLLEQWMTCSKRRSARVRSTVRRDEPTLARTLHNLLPHNLRPSKEDRKDIDPLRWAEESMDTMDLYRLFENKDVVSLQGTDECFEIINNISEEELKRLIDDEKYFNAEKESEDVETFIKQNNSTNIFSFLTNYVRTISSKWNLSWPSHLKQVYLKIYKIIRQHSPENSQNSEPLDVSAAQALLLYGELLLDYWIEKGREQGQPSPITGSIFGGDFCTLSFGDLSYICDDSEDVKFIIRCYRLEALMYLYAGTTESTVIVLQRYMTDERCDDIEVRLNNVKHHYVVNGNLNERLFNTLNRNERLEKVQKLFNEKKYDSVVEILTDALRPTAKLLTAEFVEPILDKCSQFSLLLDSLFELERYEEAFVWCETCCHEALIQCRAGIDDTDGNKSKWLVLLTNALQALPFCIDHRGIKIINELPSNRLVRLIQTLSSIVCHQVESLDSADLPFETISPWILLYDILKNHEEQIGKTNEDDEIPNSLTLLFTAHEYLGRRAWCCVDEAEILFKSLIVLLPIMESSNPETDKMLILNQQMEQIFYCLYGHPIKRNRPRYVQEHNVMGLALTWSRSHLVYRFLKTRELPMYDSSARYSISQDVEVLFRRIVDIIPNEYNPSKYVEKINNYIEGNSNELPVNKNLLPREIVDIYYLIADYYFKNKMWRKAITYYVLDVCANPNRVDSWACLALARGSMLETKLNSCETIKSEADFIKRGKMSCRCYQRSLQLDPEQSTLWIEYGSFSYMVHSFCSRLLNQEQNLSLELFDILETQKEEMLQTALKCFTSANMLWMRYEKMGVEPEIQDERWLHHYMLGKIAIKREEKPIVYLTHFMKSIKFLNHNNAKYPHHISYSSPQLYSVEALELYYRVHACILKVLEQSEEQPVDETLIRLFFEVLERTACGPFANFGEILECGYNCENIEESIKGKPLVENEVKIVMDKILFEICDGDNACYNVSKKKRKRADDEEQDDNNKVVESQDKTKSSECKVNEVDSTSDVARNDEITPTAIRKKSKEGEEVSDAPSDNKSDVIKKAAKRRKSQDSSSETLSESDTTSSGSESSEDTSSSDDSDSSSSGSTRQGSSDDETKPPPPKKLKIVDTKLTNWKDEQRCLIDRCLVAMQECVKRFPEHYKSLYRQAHYYFRSKTRSDNEKVRKLLLGEGGLFADRKPAHFFNGVWRIPSSEIDRPGSFAGHMSRCLHLLLDLLRDSRDEKMLLTLSFQLKDTPDPDKKYLRDEEREQLAKESVTLSVQAFRSKLHEAQTVSEVEEILNNSYRSYRRVNKYWTSRDSGFASLVTQCFNKYLKLRGDGKWKSNLDAAVKFCLDGTLTPLPPKPTVVENSVKNVAAPPQQPQKQDATRHIQGQATTVNQPLPPQTIVNNSTPIPPVITNTPPVRMPTPTQSTPVTSTGKPKRPRGRPAGSSVRPPNPLSQMLKNVPNMPKDLQLLYKNLPYSPQQMMNIMRTNPMFAMQASLSVQQQFNNLQAELMRQLSINQAAQKLTSSTSSSSSQQPLMAQTSANTSTVVSCPPSTSTIKTSTVSNPPMSLITNPKDHPNITITPVPVSTTKSTSTKAPSNQPARTPIIKSTQNVAPNIKSSQNVTQNIKSSQNISSKSNLKYLSSTNVKHMTPKQLTDLQSIQLPPSTPKSSIARSQTSLLKNQNPISPYNPQTSSICHPVTQLPPMGSNSGDMSLQHKLLSAKRSKQTPLKDELVSNPFRLDQNTNKNIIELSKNINDNKFVSPGPAVNPGLYISKLPPTVVTPSEQKQKDLSLSISTVNNELSSHLSSLSPKEITLTRLAQTLGSDGNKSMNDKVTVSYAENLMGKKVNQSAHSRQSKLQDLAQIQHVPASTLMSDLSKKSANVVDNRISALKAIGTHLTITQAGPNIGCNLDNKAIKQDAVRYDKADVSIVPTVKEKQKKDSCEVIFLE